MLAGLVNSKIKSKIDENTITIEYQKSPQKLIEEFELKLKDNPQKIIVLNPKAHDSVMKFIATCKDDGLKQRFYDCCNQSLARSQEFVPKSRDEIDQLVPLPEPEKQKTDSEQVQKFESEYTSQSTSRKRKSF